MVENRPLLTFFSHATLILGVVAVAFPLYVTFVASTLTLEQILAVPMPLLPGDQFIANYSQVLLAGSFGTYLSAASAVRIGLVPKIPVLRIVSAGSFGGVVVKVGKAPEFMMRVGFQRRPSHLKRG